MSVLDVLELQSGDRMTREEFHRIYERMPASFRAELIGGIVYVTSPLRRRHGTCHATLAALFVNYAARTPGVEVGDNTTILLGEDAEPQPDLYLRVLPEFGGQSRTSEDDDVVGAPELIAEVAHSSRAIDLHAKKGDYARYGVIEYLVALLPERRLVGFDLRTDRDCLPDADGIYRSRTFPGLWVHVEALFDNETSRVMDSLDRGLATPSHAGLVSSLQARRRTPGGTSPSST
ncbi:MAG: Uma2 family endonuclease [Candidatus Rokubacteria bacterium]|nr:Uma2 family endonuclease [Candidatus Rokubacteria bacterium]